MPLWLRRTTFNLMREHFEKEKEATENQQSLLNSNKNKELHKPNIQPNYSTKVAKK